MKLTTEETKRIKSQIALSLAAPAITSDIKVSYAMGKDNRVSVTVGICKADVLLDAKRNICFKVIGSGTKTVDIENAEILS